MALTASLIERTPNRLRYLVTSDGQATASPDSVVIANADGVTPDLRTDADAFRGGALDILVNTAAANQAAARALLDGAALTAVADLPTERGILSVHARNSLGDESWSVDTNEGAAAGSAPSAGFAVLVVGGPNVNLAAAVVTLEFDHTYTR
jgi:hypothetical protein